MRSFGPRRPAAGGKSAADAPSELTQWPVQLMLIPPQAPFLQGANLLIAADCVPFAMANFHDKLLKGKALLIGCPKLDDAAHYVDKLEAMFRQAGIKSVTIAHMEVPCCFGIERIVQEALSRSGGDIPLYEVTVSVDGSVLEGSAR